MSNTAVAVIALAAAGGAAVALVLACAFYLKLRAVRQAQTVLLGSGRDDLVDFAVSLQTRIDDLHRVVVSEEDARAVRFYRGRGFVPVDENVLELVLPGR